MMWSHNTEDCAGKLYVWHSNSYKMNIGAEYRDRAEVLGNTENNCTLMIKNITDTDAGLYRFSFTANRCELCAQPGVELRVGAESNLMTVILVCLGILLAVLAVTICIMRRKTGLLSEEGHRREGAQRRPTDSHSDTYAALDVNNQSPDYDTLMMLKPADSDRYPAVQESAEDPVYGNMINSENGQQAK
ncbi:uncharacterized protein [Paramormyrops kingsleyae]|uniref:uncharacterized protein isoform X2 n=1 Tax=Paramormyrops kingsleyae TaxID=1676925 RepID=UPI003B974158